MLQLSSWKHMHHVQGPSLIQGNTGQDGSTESKASTMFI